MRNKMPCVKPGGDEWKISVLLLPWNTLYKISGEGNIKTGM